MSKIYFNKTEKLNESLRERRALRLEPLREHVALLLVPGDAPELYLFASERVGNPALERDLHDVRWREHDGGRVVAGMGRFRLGPELHGEDVALLLVALAHEEDRGDELAADLHAVEELRFFGIAERHVPGVWVLVAVAELEAVEDAVGEEGADFVVGLAVDVLVECGVLGLGHECQHLDGGWDQVHEGNVGVGITNLQY